MSRVVLGLIVLGIGALVGWYVLSGNKQLSLPTAPRPTVQSTPAPSEPSLRDSGTTGGFLQDGMEKGGVASRMVVTYTDTGFSPSPLTVKSGTTVTFVNESSGSMWVASDVHPTHRQLPGFDQRAGSEKGGTYEYTFSKVGTWSYHNHISPERKGSVVVTN